MQFLHCSHAPLNSGGMIHCSLNSVSWLNSKSRARKQYFSASHLLAFHMQFMVGPCTVNCFCLVNQTFASYVFDKTQTLTRSKTYSKTPFQSLIESSSCSLSWKTLRNFILCCLGIRCKSCFKKF